jgi:DNA-binding CsgD family transcriptional regulator
MKAYSANGLTLSYRCNNDPNWTFTDISPICDRILGYPLKEIASNQISIAQIISKEDLVEVKTTLNKALINRLPFEILYRIETPYGIKTLFEQGQGIYDVDGNAKELIGFISDVTLLAPFQTSLYEQASVQDWRNEIKQIISNMNLNVTCKDIDEITDKEIMCALYFSQGLSMKEIAIIFGISPRTIELYLYRIKTKLGCHMKSELRKLFLSTRAGRSLLCNIIS